MSPHRQPSSSGPAWTVVALAAVGLAAVVAILLWVPDSDHRGGQVVLALTTMVTSIVGATYAAVRVERRVGGSVDHISDRVDQVARDVNGRMSQLIDKVPGPDTPGGDSGGKTPPAPRDGA